MRLKFILICLLFIIKVNGQTDPIELPKIIPPSPTAYELGKYGQIPVGMFTGTANVGVPLYNYNTKNLSVPISLSYNSNGIKVDQMSSNVGLGWSLNAGGVITRIIRGFPDEERTHLYPEEDIHNIGGSGSPAALDFFFAAGNNNVDTETDLYMYNFMGNSGKFIINKSGDIVLIPQSDLKIEPHYETVNSVISKGFKITTSNGVIYTFLDEEINRSRSHGAGHTEPGIDSIVSLFLSKIEHPKGDIIEFEYASNNYHYDTGISDTFTIPIPTNQTECDGSAITNGYTISSPITNTLYITGKKLVKITSNSDLQGDVDFIANYAHPETSSKKLVSQIIVRDNDLNAVKSFDFNYLSTSNNRVFLTDVNFLNPEKKYSFEYVDPQGVPERLNKSQDYWGYHNGTSNAYRFPNPQGEYIKNLLHINFQSYNIGADKSVNAIFAEKGLLNKIVYPTKGYNKFEYESNNYSGEVTTYPSIETIILNADTVDDFGSGFDDVVTIDVIPFNHIAKISVSADYNNNGCGNGNDDNNGHYQATLTITDDIGSVIPIRENTAQGSSFVSNNTIVAQQSVPLNNLNFEMKVGRVYTITLHPTFDCVISTASIEYYSQPTTTALENIVQGGLRIKNIKSFNADINQINTISYYYGQKDDKNTSSGEIGQKPFYVSNITNRVTCIVPNTFVDLFYQSLNSNHLNQLYSSSGSSTTYYKYVTESHGGDNFENGGIEHEYIIDNDVPGNPIKGDWIQSSPLVNSGWSNGFEKKSIVFKKSVTNDFITLSESINTYKKDLRHLEEIYGYSVNKKFEYLTSQTDDITHNCTQEDIDKTYVRYDCDTEHYHIWMLGGHLFDGIDGTVCVALGNHMVPVTTYHPCHTLAVGDLITYPNLINNLDITEYSTNSYWSYLDQTITKRYDSNGQNSLETTINYFYENDNHLQLTRTETTTSQDNKTIITEIDYAQDLVGQEPLMQNLIDAHRIAEPVQTKSSINNNSNVLSHQLTKYTLTNDNLLLPEIIQTAKGNQVLEDRIVYHKYDNKGNPLEVSKKDGQHITYIWGYNYTQPISKIINATYSEVETILGTNFVINEYFTSSQENSLRNGLPNAQVTTIDYLPLIGVSTVTDQNGDKQTYHYDDFNRLKFIKDTQNNILSKNEYHYRSQN